MAHLHGSPPSSNTVNVLVVDDKAENRLALRAMLARPGYTIVEAESSTEALRELLKRNFAVLLLDVVMPDMDGFTLAELVRAREVTQTVPILFVTAQAADQNLVARGYRVGAVDYLVKPLVPDIVRAKVSVFAEIYRQRMLIESSLHEKEILLREIHHRVKNNLQIISSLLNLQASRLSNDLKPLFIETTARVRSIALVHEQLYRAESFTAIDVDRYFRALTAGLLQTYGSTRTMLTVHAASSTVTIDVAIPCGLIINELVSNALRHAFPDDREGTIVVTLTEHPDSFMLEVCDDGIGMPPGIEVECATTMGLQLVTSLAHQLGGTIVFERKQGTRVHLRFPKRQPGT